VALHLPLKLARVYEQLIHGQLLKCNSSGSRGGILIATLYDGMEYKVNRSISLRCWCLTMICVVRCSERH
jgi:hypothetical protein